jgi:outer membrane protein OmpA-like peptidoglycan-associated protein
MNFWSAFFSVILAVWVAWGSYTYTCVYCKLCEDESKEAQIQPTIEENPRKDNEIVATEPQKDTSKAEIKELPKEEQLKIEEKHIVFFQYGASNMIIEPEHITYFKLLKKYLDRNPSQSILLTGHADNSGTAEINQVLGNKRAESVKTLLTTQYQLNSKQIKTESKGMDNPIADNATEVGRTKNRRVEILLQK